VMNHVDVQNAGAYVSRYIDSFDYRGLHVLLCEYHSGGDLFSIIQSYVREGPDGKLVYTMPYNVRRQLGLHAVAGVFYLHAHSIAHLDVSVENLCFDGNFVKFAANPATSHGQLKVIDYGVATRQQLFVAHPSSPKDMMCSADTAAWTQLKTPRRMYLPPSALSMHLKKDEDADEPGFMPQYFVDTSPKHEQAFGSPLTPAVTLTSASTPTSGHLAFLCLPINSMLPEGVCRPGKGDSKLPEMVRNECWDAYAADCYALGITLYYLFFGSRPNVKSPEFAAIYDGSWCAQYEARATTSQRDMEMLALVRVVDALIKPQNRIIKIDQLFEMDLFKAAPSSSASSSAPTVNA
jgi:serine/threonine protein kinase